MVNYIISLIINRGIEIIPEPSGLNFVDKDDLVLYEVAIEKKNDGAYLVTGNNRHFPNEPIIVSASEFLDIINKSEESN